MSILKALFPSYKLSPDQETVFNAVLENAVPENAAALKSAATMIARSDGDKRMSPREFSELKGIAEAFGTSELVRDRQILATAEHRARELAAHYEALATLREAPALFARAKCQDATTSAFATIELATALTNVDLSALDPETKRQLGDLVEDFTAHLPADSRLTVPVPRQYVASVYSAYDRYVNQFSPQLYARSLEALVNEIPAALDRPVHTRVSAEVVTVAKDPRRTLGASDLQKIVVDIRRVSAAARAIDPDLRRS